MAYRQHPVLQRGGGIELHEPVTLTEGIILQHVAKFMGTEQAGARDEVPCRLGLEQLCIGVEGNLTIAAVIGGLVFALARGLEPELHMPLIGNDQQLATEAALRQLVPDCPHRRCLLTRHPCEIGLLAIDQTIGADIARDTAGIAPVAGIGEPSQLKTGLLTTDLLVVDAVLQIAEIDTGISHPRHPIRRKGDGAGAVSAAGPRS